jgi:hypothetical protein
LLGEEPIIIEHFLGFEGGFYGFDMGSQNIMGSDYGSNISDVTLGYRMNMTCVHQEKIQGLQSRRREEQLQLLIHTFRS